MGKNNTKELVNAISREDELASELAKARKNEVVKTVVIAILATAILAFLGGVKYQSLQSSHIEARASEIASKAAPVAPEQSKQ